MNIKLMPIVSSDIVQVKWVFAKLFTLPGFRNYFSLSLIKYSAY